MTITNTWNVVQMDAYPEYEGETDVVFTVVTPPLPWSA
jgi:hypothetical protein